MRIGVTGIFASGKGTVCGLFQQMGAKVIDTDIVAREIMEPGSEGLRQILQAFGTGYLREDGALDRRRFARDVFSDPGSARLLNSITHPLILDIVVKRSSGSGVYMINTPLLFESGFDTIMDKTIVVTAMTAQAVERGVLRDVISAEEIKQRLDHQLSLNEKIKLADYVIDNSGSLENTRRQVIEIWNILTDTNNR
jgi:dephospho-CoA kinase